MFLSAAFLPPVFDIVIPRFAQEPAIIHAPMQGVRKERDPVADGQCADDISTCSHSIAIVEDNLSRVFPDDHGILEHQSLPIRRRANDASMNEVARDCGLDNSKLSIHTEALLAGLCMLKVTMSK